MVRHEINAKRQVVFQREKKKERQKQKMAGPHGAILTLWEDLRRVNAGVDVTGKSRGAEGSGVVVPARDQKHTLIAEILRLIVGSDPYQTAPRLAFSGSTEPPAIKGSPLAHAACRSDLSRVLQSCAKFGRHTDRNCILRHVSAHLPFLAMNQYAAPLLSALSRHSRSPLNIAMARLLIPYAHDMLPHRVAFHVLDTIYTHSPGFVRSALDAAAVAKESSLRSNVLQTFRAGLAKLPEFQAPTTGDEDEAHGEGADAEDAAGATLGRGGRVVAGPASAAAGLAGDVRSVASFDIHAELLANTSLRRRVMRPLSDVMDKVVTKGASMNSEYVQRAVELFLRYAQLSSAVEVATEVVKHVVTILNTRSGALIALHCINYCGPPGWFAMLRSMRRSVADVLKGESSVLVLCRLMDVLPLESAKVAKRRAADVLSERDIDDEDEDEEGVAEGESPADRVQRIASQVGVRTFVESLLTTEVLRDVRRARDLLLEHPIASKFVLHLLAAQPYRKRRYFSGVQAQLLWSEPEGDNAPTDAWCTVGGILGDDEDKDGDEIVSIEVCPSEPSPAAKHAAVLDAIIPVLKAIILADTVSVPRSQLRAPDAGKGGGARKPKAMQRSAERGEGDSGTVRVPLSLARIFPAKRVMSELLYQARSDAPHPALRDPAFVELLASAMSVDLVREVADGAVGAPTAKNGDKVAVDATDAPPAKRGPPAKRAAAAAAEPAAQVAAAPAGKKLKKKGAAAVVDGSAASSAIAPLSAALVTPTGPKKRARSAAAAAEAAQQESPRPKSPRVTFADPVVAGAAAPLSAPAAKRAMEARVAAGFNQSPTSSVLKKIAGGNGGARDGVEAPPSKGKGRKVAKAPQGGGAVKGVRKGVKRMKA